MYRWTGSPPFDARAAPRSADNIGNREDLRDAA